MLLQMDLLFHTDIVKVYVCLLFMLQLMDFLLHMNIVIINVVVMLYVPDLLWRQQCKLLMNCVDHVYVMPEELILSVTFLYLYK